MSLNKPRPPKPKNRNCWKQALLFLLPFSFYFTVMYFYCSSENHNSKSTLDNSNYPFARSTKLVITSFIEDGVVVNTVNGVLVDTVLTRSL